MNPGSHYNQRVGRRICPKSASVELQFGFVSAYTGTTRNYPIYASIRVIHGWAKEGCQQLSQIATDVANMYSEIPFSKYRVLSDKTYTRKCNPVMTYVEGSSPATNPQEFGAYAPFRIKRNWYPNGKHNITFTDSLGAANTTYAGWTPFLLILNPNHGTGISSLKLEFKYIKRVFAFKDA